MKEPFCSRVYVRAETSVAYEMLKYTIDVLMIWMERKHCMHSRIRFALRKLEERKKHAQAHSGFAAIVHHGSGSRRNSSTAL